MSQVHHLKCWPEFFDAFLSGKKRFDIRQEDGRRFDPGDSIIMQEWDPATGHHTGRGTGFIVTYCLRSQPWVPRGYVAMSLRPIYVEGICAYCGAALPEAAMARPEVR